MILAIETSSMRHSLSLAHIEPPHAIIHETHWDASGRAGRLLIELDGVRAHLKNVRLIAVGTGPGSFSGIRAAISAAKGLRAVLGCPLAGICSADVVGRELAHVSRLGVFADAKRRELYFTEYCLGLRTRGPMTVAVADLEDQLTKLTLAVSGEPIPGVPERACPTASTLARMAGTSWLRDPESLQDPEPIYLRGPAKLPPNRP